MIQVNKPRNMLPKPDIKTWREDYKVKKLLSLAGNSRIRERIFEREIVHHVPIPDSFNVQADLKTFPELIMANN